MSETDETQSTDQPTPSRDGTITERLLAFFRDYYKDELGKLADGYPNDKRSITIDYHDLYRFDPHIADDLQEQPGEMREYLKEAVRLYDYPVDITPSRADVRVINLPETETFSIGEYRNDHAGEYLAVAGQVKKRSDAKPRITDAAFECQRCGTLTRIPQSGSTLQEPHECQGCERQGPFQINFAESDFDDFQLLRLVQPPEETKGGNGSTVDVHLTDDLVDSVEVGDRAVLSGELCMEQQGSNQEQSRLFDYYLEGNGTEVKETDFEDIDIDEHREEIEALAAGEYGDPYELLADCIAPDIQGERERTIRKAAGLQLFRGVRSQKPNGNWVRGDIHILQLGDPSTGKSQVLRAVQRIAPRSAFASGKGASAAGMTAAAEPDNFGDSEWSLEAGALVLANKGIACIDEIDKVKEDAISSMHDALEAPQEVAINKAGINTSLPTQTAVLAGGNPKYGRFNPYEPIGEQFEIGPTLLSRFDLIFTLEDTPERERDRRVGSTVTETRQNAHRYTHHREEMTDEEIEEQELPVDIEVLRAWIAYARQEVYPVIGPELQSKIVDAYVNFRNDINSSSDSDVDPIPLTARKIDAIQRLVEASARVELREEATEADLQRATRKIRQSLEDVGRDPETGEFDADMVEAGASRSQQKRMETLEELIKQIGGDDPAPVNDVLSKASDAGIDIGTAEAEIQKLANQGDIIKYPNGDGDEVAEWIQ